LNNNEHATLLIGLGDQNDGSCRLCKCRN